MRKALVRWAGGFAAVCKKGLQELSPRTLQFYGGCALIGLAMGQWEIVGGILVLHAILGPLLSRWETRP